jgi:hypothetical protein
MVNVAGTRTFVAPPAGDDDVAAAPGPAPTAVVCFPVVVVLARADVVAPGLVAPGADVVVAGLVVVVGPVPLVEVVDEWLELPHPAASASAHTVPKRHRRRCITAE